MKRLLFILINLTLECFPLIAKSENLLEIYKYARINNPELRKSLNERDEALEKINEVRSSLLPKLLLITDYTHVNNYDYNRSVKYNSASISIKLNQTVFNMSKWQALTLQEKIADIQNISYKIDQQKLILDTTKAYLNVLSKIDIFYFIEAQKQNFHHKLDQINKLFKVGLTDINDLQNTQIHYDKIVASKLIAYNNLIDSLSVLYKITGKHYLKLSSLNIKNFKKNKLKPLNLLLREAMSYNLTILQARLNQDLAHEQLIQARNAYLPTIDLNITTGVYSANSNAKDKSNSSQNKINLDLSIPIFQGGIVNSQVKQANCRLATAKEQLETVYRNVTQQVYLYFNKVNNSIDEINIYKQAAVSAQKSLSDMEAGYLAGTYNIINLLNATTTLYDIKQQLSNARYNYLTNLVNIKFILGTLSERDLISINNMLGQNVSTSPENI